MNWKRALVTLCWLAVAAARAGATYVNFESGQVRPLALSPDGTKLFVLNTPDARLEVFTVTSTGLVHRGSVAVGLEPVAVAARTNDEVWVVNHLSDSVSIVDITGNAPRVVKTLLVGDEPRDIVFAGARNSQGFFQRAFVTTARRGQALPASVPASLTTPGIGRALVWVFAAEDLGDGLGGAPETVLELFGDTPRALAASADGATVYAAVFHSGNQTTAIAEGAVCNGGANVPSCALDGVQVPGGLANGMVPGGLPAPNRNFQNINGPEVGLIVKFNPLTLHWEDGLGRNWTNAVRFDLPDLDVFQIDARAGTPAETTAFAGVGTVLFNMVVDPTDGTLFVSNTEARNEVRFEGPGTNATTVRGHLHEARITVIDSSGVRPRHLNKHLLEQTRGYRTQPMPSEVKLDSLATPLEMAIDSAGTLFVAAFGSAKIGVFARSQLVDNTFAPNANDHIDVSGGGPTGLVLDDAHDRLYVLTRFDNAVKVIDTNLRAEIASHALHNPEPAEIVDGRRFLYDARLSSSNGEASCSSCHVFADFDSLGWDLGNPDDTVKSNPNPTGPLGSHQDFHPMKGPMTTQTLRGMATQGPMHWRGDRTGGTFDDDPQSLDEQLAFETFNVAFEGLLGRDEGEIAPNDMTAFARFVLTVASPPSPVRRLDNQLTPPQAAGQNIFRNRFATDGIASCEGCHELDPSQGFFGTGGRTTFENEPQEFKVAPLRQAYQKVGMFGMPDVAFVGLPVASSRHQGDQIRGYGFLHDGSIATVFDFLHATVFFLSERERHELEDYILAFDNTFAPLVGQQVSLTATSSAAVNARIDLMRARAQTPFIMAGQSSTMECDLIVRGRIGGADRGYLYDPAGGSFVGDRAGEAALSDTALRSSAAIAGQELTYTCVPPGSGRRLALDRDGDTFLDRDELDAGSDPADPTDTPETQSCDGDCDGGGSVTVDEIVVGVELALGTQAIESCPRFDGDRNGRVTVDELLAAVDAALKGC